MSDDHGDNVWDDLPEMEPGISGRRLVRTSLTEVEGAERIECTDGPLWILETAEGS